MFTVPRVCWRLEEGSSLRFLPGARSCRSVLRKSPLNSSWEVGGWLGSVGVPVRGWHRAGICWSGALHPSTPWFLRLPLLLGDETRLLVFWDLAKSPACLSFPICSGSSNMNSLSCVKNWVLWCRKRASFSCLGGGLECDSPGLCTFM